MFLFWNQCNSYECYHNKWNVLLWRLFKFLSISFTRFKFECCLLHVYKFVFVFLSFNAIFKSFLIYFQSRYRDLIQVHYSPGNTWTMAAANNREPFSVYLNLEVNHLNSGAANASHWANNICRIHWCVHWLNSNANESLHSSPIGVLFNFSPTEICIKFSWMLLLM